uniref:Uncharacterized protein n=1 Tax=Arundo donax TaxID=35708 RepID=A0A0A9G596_ARUDO
MCSSNTNQKDHDPIAIPTQELIFNLNHPVYIDPSSTNL